MPRRLTERRRKNNFRRPTPPDPTLTYGERVEDYRKRLENLGMPPEVAQATAIDFAKSTLNIK